MSRPPNYLQSSPVRGQLDPYDPNTPAGWRYLQTTDTLNELKILLPPGTAAMYEQLLKLETYELGKNPINWARILEIRHLKERMIRKSSQYAKASMTFSKMSSPFQSFILPDDFRVKEMERWFREQQKRANASALRRSTSATQPSVAAPSNRNYSQPHCSQCIASASGLPPVKLSASGVVPPKTEPLAVHATAKVNASTSSKLGLYSRAQAFMNISRAIKPERAASLPVSTKRSRADPSLSRSSVVVSPLPLPIILRNQRSEFGLDDEVGQPESALGDPELPEPSLDDTPPPPAPLKDIPVDEIQRSAQSSPSGDETSPNLNGVARRRSCIKRGSVSELGAKTVSWADDQELNNQMSRYTSVVRDAQASGRQWEEIREIYLEQISNLETLQLQVQDGLECLKSESEHLQHVDGTIRRQREKLRLTFDELERKQSAFNERVKEALEQADDVMSRHGLRKTSLPMTNE